MSITFVGSAKGTTTATAPTHAVGDIMLVVTTRNASATAPTLVSGFQNIGTNTANTYSIRAAWKPCTSTSDATGTWTNATECIVTIWRPSAGFVCDIGAFAFAAGLSTTASYTGLTLVNTDGTSWVARFGGTKTAAVGINGAMTGFSQRQDETGTGELVSFDTNGGVSSNSTATQTITSSAWKTFSVEIVETPIGAGSTLTNIYQHIAGGGNPFIRGQSGNAYKLPLLNSSGAGNCLVLAISYDGGATVSSVTDNINGTWGAASISVTPGAGNQDSKLYIFPNITAGQTTITVTFGANVTVFQYCVTELYGIDSSPSAGTTSRSNSATQDANSFTPTNNNATGGNFIWAYFCKSIQTPAGLTASLFAGPSFTMLNADIGWNNANDSIPKLVEGFVQTTSAAITPAFRSIGDTADTWNSMAIALKINSASGTAPSASQIQIRAIHHFGTGSFPASATYVLQCPTLGGNLQCIACDDPNLNTLTVTDNLGNTWTNENAEGIYWFGGSAVANPNLTIFITGGGSDVILSWRFIDIFNASPSPFDSVTQNFQVVNGLSSFTASPSPSAGKQPGLTFANIGLGAGPGLAVTAPSGAVWDLCTYTGETDTDLIENADITAHFRYTATGSQTWTFTITNQVTNSTSGGFILFTEAINGQATFAGAGSFTANATVQAGGGGTTWSGAANFNGAGSFTANAQLIEVAQATFAGAGLFTANATAQFAAQATFADAGAFTATATVQFAAQATFAGAGSFTATGLPVDFGFANFAGAGAFTANAGPAVLAAAANFAGAGAFTANAQLIEAAQATFAGAGSFAANTQLLEAAQATFVGAGSFTANATALFAAQATFAGVGAFTANATTQIAGQQGAANFAGTGLFTANAAQPQRAAATNFAGAGAFTANATVQMAAQAAFAGAGGFTATAALRMQATASFAGAGAFTASGTVPQHIAAQATFAGAGSFTANATTQGVTTWTGAAAFIGSGLFIASATVLSAALPVPNGRWRPVFDTSYVHTVIAGPPPQFLTPAPLETGFTLYFISPAAGDLPAGAVLVLTRPDGSTISVPASRFYTGINDPTFSIYLTQGTYAAYVTSTDLNQQGTWSMEIKTADNSNISGVGYFSVAA